MQENAPILKLCVNKERVTDRAYINTDNKPKTVKCQQKLNLGKGNISVLCTIFILATLL